MADDDYTIGYGKPPKHGQFKPGQSGNPGGRPKKKPTVYDVVQSFLAEKVWATENGQKKQMTKLEVAIASLFSVASKGNVPASKLLLELKAAADAQGSLDGASQLSPEDSEALLAEVDWLAFVQQQNHEAASDTDG